MKNKKTIYYAHHLWKYDTEIEEFELDIIRKKLPNYEIINPNKYFDFSEDMTEEEIMNICLETVRDCEALVFSSLSGVIGRGVYSEVRCALVNNKEVYYLKQDKLIKIDYIEFGDIEEKFQSNRTFKVVKDFGIVEVL